MYYISALMHRRILVWPR